MKVSNLNCSSSKFSHLKWLTQVGHSLGLANRGGTACRFTVIHFLETNCAYKQLRGRGFFNFFLSLNIDFKTKKLAIYLGMFTMALKSHWEGFILQHHFGGYFKNGGSTSVEEGMGY